MSKLKKSLAITSGAFALIGLGLATKNTLNIKNSKREFPRLGKFCNVQGSSIHYFSEGEGKPLVFIHGENGDIYDFYLSPIWSQLKKTNKLFALDRPGYGYSTRADWKDYGFRNQGEIINQTLRLIGISKPILIGYGESCGIILAILMEHQNKYSGAILIDEKLPNKIDLVDKINTLPLLGKLLLWTISPVIAQKKANNKNKNSDLPRENIKKSVMLDILPNTILSNSQDKEFMKIEELKNLSEISPKITIPVIFIKKQIDSESALINQLNLEKLISNMHIVSEKDINSKNIPLLNSQKIIDEINKILK